MVIRVCINVRVSVNQCHRKLIKLQIRPGHVFAERIRFVGQAVRFYFQNKPVPDRRKPP